MFVYHRSDQEHRQQIVISFVERTPEQRAAINLRREKMGLPALPDQHFDHQLMCDELWETSFWEGGQYEPADCTCEVCVSGKLYGEYNTHDRRFLDFMAAANF
jgi:hypothetical protein